MKYGLGRVEKTLWEKDKILVTRAVKSRDCVVKS